MIFPGNFPELGRNKYLARNSEAESILYFQDSRRMVDGQGGKIGKIGLENVLQLCIKIW
jgi:hypothetical protein